MSHHYPVTFETYHIVTSTATQPIICESLAIALQTLSTLSSGTIAHVERVVSTHHMYQIYGTSQSPLPPAPVKAMTTKTLMVEHIHKG